MFMHIDTPSPVTLILPSPQSIMRQIQKLAALTHKREGQMGVGRGVSRRETPMVWFARLLGLDHSLPVTPRGVVKACICAVLTSCKRSPEKGGSLQRTSRRLALGNRAVAGCGRSLLQLLVRLCEGIAGGRTEGFSFAFFFFSVVVCLFVKTGPLYVALVVLKLNEDQAGLQLRDSMASAS